jgi:hypothetical protein
MKFVGRNFINENEKKKNRITHFLIMYSFIMSKEFGVSIRICQQ